MTRHDDVVQGAATAAHAAYQDIAARMSKKSTTDGRIRSAVSRLLVEMFGLAVTLTRERKALENRVAVLEAAVGVGKGDHSLALELIDDEEEFDRIGQAMVEGRAP